MTWTSVVRLAGLWLICLAGCQTAAPTAGPVDRPADPPSYESLRAAQAERIAKLRYLETSGVIEMRWTDADGTDHFEPQIDCKLFWGLPRHLALRMYKFDTLFWLGSDDEQFWFFDLFTGSDTVVYLGQYGDSPEDSRIPGMLHPMTMLDLLGMSPLPDEAQIGFDGEVGAWTIEVQGRGGPLRVYLDIERYWPIRVETLSGDGEVLQYSTLRNYIRAESEGMPDASFPRVPGQITLVDDVGRGEARVTLDRPRTNFDRVRLERATDLDGLIDALGPDRTELLRGNDG